MILCPKCPLAHEPTVACATAAMECLETLKKQGVPGFCDTCREPVTIIRPNGVVHFLMLEADGSNHKDVCPLAVPTLKLKEVL